MDAKDVMITRETEVAMQQRFADQHKEQLERSIEQKLERAEFELTQLFAHIRALVRQVKSSTKKGFPLTTMDKFLTEPDEEEDL